MRVNGPDTGPGKRKREKKMEEYMLVVRGYNYAGVTPEIMEKRMNAYRPWLEKMTQAGFSTKATIPRIRIS
jgi:hypothetical protein